MIRYRSTRDTKHDYDTVSSAEAIKKGLAPDGGLYVPTKYPVFSDGDFNTLRNMNYAEKAAYILSMFLEDYDEDELLKACREAYSEKRFTTGIAGTAAPLRRINDGIYSLELWHGPTSAFKDMALQIMPRLLSLALKMTGETNTAHILVATSGDTGKAALEGYKDVDGVKITVFYPVDGVSNMQKRQMQTTTGSNVHVTAVRGNFDDAQTGVKLIFQDKSLAKKALDHGFFFGSANSINWGRLAPQIVYYVSAYYDLVKEGRIPFGQKINICVPTGNFGNVFAAYIAKTMGLPVNKLIVASNSNNVLTDFIETGTYDRTREFHKTISPSMDILISSNLERLLYTLGGAELTSELMTSLKENGKYDAPSDIMDKLRDNFCGYYMTEEETKEIIKEVYQNHGYLMDPHTAVGYGCVSKYIRATGDNTPVILASTASPYKFAPAVNDALGIDSGDDDISSLEALSSSTGTSIPYPLKEALDLEIRFNEVIDPSEMPDIPFKV